MSDPTQVRPSRPPTSRGADRVAMALGDEKAFAAAAVLVAAALVGGAITGRLGEVSSVTTLITVVMVFAVQHTSSRESRALNLKLDELIRVSQGRNELIGAEDESHGTLAERREQVLRDSRRG
jgi:low affinity Fe/Cu permease